MCYPGDNLWTSSIPQWTMWYVMELGEYVKRAESLGIKDAGEPFRELVDKILGFFRKYENSDGLLEKLPYWNFVEWTRANDWVQDVNYPTNMLYSAVLDTAAELYDRPELCEKSAKIRREVLRSPLTASTSATTRRGVKTARSRFSPTAPRSASMRRCSSGSPTLKSRSSPF